MLELIAPQRCALCACFLSLDERSLCRGCRLRYPVPDVPPTPDGRPRLVAWPFEGEVRSALLDLKFHRGIWRVDGLAQGMATLLAPQVQHGPCAVVSVPLHARRLRERGYNQSALLGKRLAALLGARFYATAIRRQSHASPQAGRAGHERALIRDAYAPGRLPPEPTIILLDDITTSGHTFDACANALLQSGRPSLLCAAIASGDFLSYT